MQRLAIPFMIGLALAGCGSLPLAPQIDHVAPTEQASLPTPSVGPPTSRTASAQALLERVQAAANATKVWKAVTRTEMLKTDGSQDYNEAKIVWQRPGKMSAEVVAAASNKKIGTKLIFDGHEEVRVKTFLFGFIALRVTLDVLDSRMVDARGRSLKDTSTEHLFAALFHPQTIITELGPGMAANEPVDLLDVRSPLAFKGIVRETIGISRRTLLPILRDSFDAKGQRVYRLELKQMRVNVPVAAADFSLD